MGLWARRLARTERRAADHPLLCTRLAEVHSPAPPRGLAELQASVTRQDCVVLASVCVRVRTTTRYRSVACAPQPHAGRASFERDSVLAFTARPYF